MPAQAELSYSSPETARAQEGSRYPALALAAESDQKVAAQAPVAHPARLVRATAVSELYHPGH